MKFGTSSITTSFRAGLLALFPLLLCGLPSGVAAQTAVAEDAEAMPAVEAETAYPGAVPYASDRTEVDPEFRLGPGDVLQVRVLEDPSLDSSVLVRPDGRITVPLAGSVMAAGRTPEAVAEAIQRELQPDFVEPPTVTVSLLALAPGTLEEEEFLTVYVLGEVNSPGGFQVQEPIGFLQALSLAGGPGIFAAKERIQVRQKSDRGVEQVYLVNYEAIEEGAAAPQIMLGDGDTVMVPERGLFE